MTSISSGFNMIPAQDSCQGKHIALLAIGVAAIVAGGVIGMQSNMASLYFQHGMSISSINALKNGLIAGGVLTAMATVGNIVYRAKNPQTDYNKFLAQHS